MPFLWSLGIKPNWAPSFSPAWMDITSTIDLQALSSITIASGRSEDALVATASDLSLTCSNAAGEFDSLFDASKILGGALPPVNGESLRVPVAHYGEILLCRRATHLPLWQVIGYAFVDPVSVKFDRQARTCTFTAYAPGKLLEVGNSEHVHRFWALVPARPFVVPVDPITGHGAVEHPAQPNGVALDTDGNPNATQDDWWRIFGGADPFVYIAGNPATVVPLLAGDQFQVVRAVVIGGWIEGMQTVQIVNKTFTVANVVTVGADLFFQTTEVASDPALYTFGYTAAIELLDPWYRSRDWKALIDGSDGNPNCLKNVANAALAALDVSDTIAFYFAPSLPLLPATSQLFAQPIYQPDVVPGCAGVSYAHWGATPTLFHQRYAGGASPVTGKPDILAADEAGTAAAASTYSPGAFSGYTAGPDDTKSVRLLSSSINDQLDAAAPPDYQANDIPLAGQDLHQFKEPEIATGKLYDSTHWCRAPSSYRSGSEPKRYYRIYARGRYVGGAPMFRKGIEITEVTTPDTGATWTIVSNSRNFPASSYPDDTTATPTSSRSSRPSIKVFELDPTHFLYVWVDPIKWESYCHESATDDVAAGTLIVAAPFIAGGANDSPILSSSAVHWPDGSASGVTLFFSDRADRSGVDVYYYAPGPTWTLATVVDLSGLGLPKSLLGADWINAVADSSRSPVRLYVMVGKVLYAMHVSFAAGTLTISEAQAVPIDQVNYDLNIESVSEAMSNPNAIAWLTCPVTQAFAGEPDYSASSDALIVGTSNAVYIVSNTAANIVDIADFTGLSVAAALAKLVVIRDYLVLTAADQAFVADPDAYTPVPTVSFYARLETVKRLNDRGEDILDLTALTESVNSGTWLQNYQSVQVQNSKLKVGPAFSSNTLTDLDGNTFTINASQNAASAALNIDNPFLTTVSFAQLLANLYAQEFVVPRLGANIVIRSPYAQGLGYTILPGLLVKYLLRPPDSINSRVEAVGRILTIDYGLDTALDTLGIA